MLTYTQKNRNRKPLSEILPAKMPLGLCIEPTNICNFKCIQCPVSLPLFQETINHLGNMEMGLYNKIIQDVKSMGRLRNLNLYGDVDLISKIDPNKHTDETLLQGYYGNSSCSGIKRICTTPFLSLNIKCNGDVGICIVDWNKGTKVGNIKEESLSEIWFSKTLRKFREMHIRSHRQKNISCKNCKFLYGNPDNMDDFSEEKYQEILNYKG